MSLSLYDLFMTMGPFAKFIVIVLAVMSVFSWTSAFPREVTRSETCMSDPFPISCCGGSTPSAAYVLRERFAEGTDGAWRVEDPAGAEYVLKFEAGPRDLGPLPAGR